MNLVSDVMWCGCVSSNPFLQESFVNSSLRVLGVSLLSAAFLAGCGGSGPGLVKSTGQVTYKNKGLAGATVKFYPTGEGPMAVAITDEEGNFSVTTNGRAGAVLGMHKVSITKSSDAAGAASMPANPTPDDMRKMAMDNMKKPSGPKSEIPEKYASAEASNLSAEVTSNASNNVFQFDLQ